MIQIVLACVVKSENEKGQWSEEHQLNIKEDKCPSSYFLCFSEKYWIKDID